MTAADYIQALGLQAHPEGGFYKESYRSAGWIGKDCLPGFTGQRNFSTSIYFLLPEGSYSAFHRIKSDEGWHFYEGGCLRIHVIEEGGHYRCIKLGRKMQQGEQFQFTVPAGAWFASEPEAGTAFALVGCTVAPGFDFEDFEMGTRETLLRHYPQHASVIGRLCR